MDNLSPLSPRLLQQLRSRTLVLHGLPCQALQPVAWVSSVPAWGGPGQLTTLPYWGAEIALTLESSLCACGE